MHSRVIFVPTLVHGDITSPKQTGVCVRLHVLGMYACERLVRDGLFAVFLFRVFAFLVVGLAPQGH